MLSAHTDDTETRAPFYKQMRRDPLLAEKDGYVVLVVDETLEDIPSWVEWDRERKTISINHMGGGVLEGDMLISAENLDKMKKIRKVLLSTNDGEQKLTHYITFLAK